MNKVANDDRLSSAFCESMDIANKSWKQRLQSNRGSEVPVLTIAAEPDFNSKEAWDRRLDHALEETFPASDPISVICD